MKAIITLLFKRKHCPYCGAELMQFAEFCPRCGRRVWR
jgi:predicted amidophosphoribosyltransferase